MFVLVIYLFLLLKLIFDRKRKKENNMMLPKINLIILGDAAVGKTSLLRCIDNREF